MDRHYNESRLTDFAEEVMTTSDAKQAESTAFQGTYNVPAAGAGKRSHATTSS